MSYYPNAFGSFVYGPSTPFGFSAYDEMSTMNGENESNGPRGSTNAFVVDPSRVPYTLVHTTKRADPNIDVTLENADLWKKFAELNLEMIITKNGR